MGFCTRCGSKKTEDGLCPKCDGGARRTPQPPPMQPRHRGHEPQPPPGYHGGAGYGHSPHGHSPHGHPPHGHPPHGHPPHGHPPHGHPPHGHPPHGYPPHGQPGHGHYGGSLQHGYHQAMRSEFMQDLMVVVKGFFTGRPEGAFEHVLRMKSHIWLALAGAFVLLTSFVMMRMGSAFVPGVAHNFIPWGRIFMYSAFGAILTFFLLGLVVKITSLTVNVQMSFPRVLNVVSVAMIPTILSLVVGLVFSLFSTLWVLPVMSIGSLASFVYLLVAIQRICGRIPLWAVVIGYTIYVVIATVIVIALMSAFMASIVNDFMNAPFPLLDFIDLLDAF